MAIGIRLWIVLCVDMKTLDTAVIRMNSGRNDGVVLTWSVKSLMNSTNLGHTNHCHTGLLDREEYRTFIVVMSGEELVPVVHIIIVFCS